MSVRFPVSKEFPLLIPTLLPVFPTLVSVARMFFRARPMFSTHRATPAWMLVAFGYRLDQPRDLPALGIESGDGQSFRELQRACFSRMSLSGAYCAATAEACWQKRDRDSNTGSDPVGRRDRAGFLLPSLEQRQIDRITHRAIAPVARVQVIVA